MVNPSASSTMKKATASATAPKKAVAVAPPPVPEAAPVAAPVKKVVKAKAEVVAPTPAPVAPTVTPAVETATTDSSTEEVSWQQELKSVQDQLTAVREAAATALSALKRLEKRAAREIKDASKKRKVRKELPEGAEAKPSVFKTPIPVSDELATFLGQPKGSLMSRSDVTKAVMSYVKDKKLNEKHSIKADVPLQKLMGIAPSDELTIFNLQRYLNRHYPKAAAAPKA